MPDLQNDQIPEQPFPPEPKAQPESPPFPSSGVTTPADQAESELPTEENVVPLPPEPQKQESENLAGRNIGFSSQENFKTGANPSSGEVSSDKSLPSAPSSSVVPPISASNQVPTVFPKKSGFPFKKIFLILLAALVLVGLVFGIIRLVLPKLNSGGRLQEGTLTYWGLWEPDGVINEIISDFENGHQNIKVKYVQQSSKEYRERLQSALAKGDGPDIFRFHTTWLPMFKNELDPVPASVMDASTFKQTFYPVADSSLRYGTNYLGIPLEVDTLALFYNQDIFSAAGVVPPATWDELRKTAVQLTLRDSGGSLQRGGVALGTTKNVWHWPDILALMMVQNGADLAKPTGQLAEDALSFYLLFTKTDGVWDDTMPDSLNAFATNKAAMFFGYSWDVFEIEKINPNLNFKIISAPQLPGTDIAWASFWVEGVSQKSNNKSAAWEFLKYLSSKETMQKLYEAEAKVRPFGEPYSRVDMADLIKGDPLVAPFILQAPKAKTWYLCSRTFDNGINDMMIKYFEDAVNSGSAASLKTTAEGVTQILSQYGLTSQTSR